MKFHPSPNQSTVQFKQKVFTETKFAFQAFQSTYQGVFLDALASLDLLIAH